MRKYAKYIETEELKGYDVLLNEYEPGFTTKEYDEFFELLKTNLVPFIKSTVKTCLHNYNLNSKKMIVRSSPEL